MKIGEVKEEFQLQQGVGWCRNEWKVACLLGRGVRSMDCYRLHTDLRQGIDNLSTVIRRQLGVDPFQKNVLFMFCSRKPDKIKCLIYGKNHGI